MKIVLRPYETMKQRRAIERLDADAANIHRVIRNNPGIGIVGIASDTGLTRQRIKHVIHRINEGEAGYPRVEYAKLVVRSGRYAGHERCGWFATNLKRHHPALDQADEHAALVQAGIQRGRLIRLVQARGIRGAEEWVAKIEERLGLSAEALAEADLDAFLDLVLEAASED